MEPHRAGRRPLGPASAGTLSRAAPRPDSAGHSTGRVPPPFHQSPVVRAERRVSGARSTAAVRALRALRGRRPARSVQLLGDLQRAQRLCRVRLCAGGVPPGKMGEISNAIRVTSVLARCHLLVYHMIHDLEPDAEVGWAQHYVVFEPVANLLDRWVASLLNETFNETFLKLIEQGRLRFPLSLLDGDASQVEGACDFVGLNVYNRLHVEFDPVNLGQLFSRIFVPEGVPQGDPGVERPYGEAYPRAVRVAVERAARLKKPIYILENGVPDGQD